jgi:hypothetical protein
MGPCCRLYGTTYLNDKMEIINEKLIEAIDKYNENFKEIIFEKSQAEKEKMAKEINWPLERLETWIKEKNENRERKIDINTYNVCKCICHKIGSRIVH